MLRAIYKITSQVLSKRASAYLTKRIEQGKEEPTRINERYGIASRARPSGTLIWIHAASVGEVRSILALIHRLLGKHLGWHVLVTTGTVSSARIISAELPENAIHQYLPLDVPSWVNSFLDHWQPDAAVWVEQEIWPNMLGEIHRRKIPAILANGRLTETSFNRWKWIQSMARGLLAPFKHIYAQSSYDAERLASLSGKDIKNLGNLKYAAEPLPHKQFMLEKLHKEVGDRPLWLASSTHMGEEFILEDAHKTILKSHSNALLIIVPRHPDRGDQIINGLNNNGLIAARRSFHEPINPGTQVYVADTFSELGLFYRLCNIVFMGGSLVPVGGHNLIEPAQLGATILYGPHMENFQEVKELFEQEQLSYPIKTAEDLATRILELMGNPEHLNDIANKAHALISKQGQVLDHLAQDIEGFTTDAVEPQ